MSSETRLTSKNFQDMSQDSESDQDRKFSTEYITYSVNGIGGQSIQSPLRFWACRPVWGGTWRR